MALVWYIAKEIYWLYQTYHEYHDFFERRI